MAKSKIFGLYFMLLLSYACSAQQIDIRERIKAVYTSQLGVREKTGKNDGPMVETYLKYCGLGKGYAWCAAFTCWVYGQVDVANPKNAWSPAMFPASKVIYAGGKATNTPQTGDVGGIYYPNLKRVGHVFFIDKWGDKQVTTVEGNTNGAGSREGDGVYKKIRLTRQIYKVARFVK